MTAMVVIAAMVSVSFVGAGTVLYIRHTLKNPDKPVLASWAVMCITNLLSFITYWTTREHSYVGNISNVGGTLSSLAIFLMVARATWIRGGKLQFSKFQKGCLLGAIGIFTLWITLVGVFAKSGFVPNLLTQVLMVIGYLVTVDKLLTAPQVSEPKGAWTCIALSCTAGLVPSLARRDVLGGIFSMRAIVSSATMVLLIRRRTGLASKRLP